MERIGPIGIALGVWATASSAADPLVAERIVGANVEQRLIGGTDAIGGLGDWYLANDIVEVIVDDPSRRHAKLNHGGTVVDVGLRDRTGEDQFARLFPIVNLDQRVQVGYDSIEAEVDPDGGWARLVVSASRGLVPVERGSWWQRAIHPLVPAADEIAEVYVETEYRVQPGEPFVRIRTTLRNEGDRPAPVFAYGDVWMRGGRSLRSWTADTLHPEASVGFHHTTYRAESVFDVGDALEAFSYVALPGLRPYPPIAYALVAPERVREGRLNVGINDAHVVFAAAFVEEPAVDRPGAWDVVKGTRGELAAGASWVYERRLLVTGRSDVASATDVIFPLVGFADGTGGVVGRVEPVGAPAVVQVDDADSGAPITAAVTGSDGTYRATLPPGRYRLTVRRPHRPDRTAEVEVPPATVVQAPTVADTAPCRLRMSPAFVDGGPGRIVVLGVDGTADAAFDPELFDFRLDGRPTASGTETRDLHVAGGAFPDLDVELRPGSYRLVATRGPAHTLDERLVHADGPGCTLSPAPFVVEPVIELDGWFSADYHVHAQASDDSGMPNEARLRSFLAETVDLMVATDHDHRSHYAPALDALDARDRIRVIEGAEVTSSAPSPAAPWTSSHHNAWPIPYRPLAHRQGAPPSQDLTVAELYAMLRRDYEVEVVQLNHPGMKRPDFLNPGNYFTHLGSIGEPYDPGLPIDVHPNRAMLEVASDGRTRALDFDVIEVMNAEQYYQYVRTLDDWYSLLRQGFRSVATANSDTHGPSYPAGYPRNYVAIDRPFATHTDSELNDALLSGRVVGTNGPLIPRFTVDGIGMGETVSVRDGRVTVELEVVAADWVPVDEIRLMLSGERVETWPSPERDRDGVLRFAVSHPLALERDGFLTLEVGAARDAEPESWAADHPGFYTEAIAPTYVAAAFTNPIYLDADGDGAVTPPGIPPRYHLGRWLTLLVVGLLAGAWLRRRRG